MVVIFFSSCRTFIVSFASGVHCYLLTVIGLGYEQKALVVQSRRSLVPYFSQKAIPTCKTPWRNFCYLGFRNLFMDDKYGVMIILSWWRAKIVTTCPARREAFCLYPLLWGVNFQILIFLCYRFFSAVYHRLFQN